MDGGSSSSVALGVTRSRTLLFLSFRESAPRPTKRRRGASGAAGVGGEDPLGAVPKKGTYFDASGQLLRDHRRTSEDPYRDHEDEEEVGGEAADAQALLISRDTHTIEMPSLPPKWVDVSDQIEEILSDLNPKMTKLDRLHSKHLLPGFVDRSQEEREIETLSNEITREFRRCSKMIAALATFTEDMRRQSKSKHEISLAINVQTALAQRVQSISGQFRKKQSNYMQRLKGQDVRHREVLGELGLTIIRGGNSSHSKSPIRIQDEELAVREDVELSRQQLQSQSQQQLLLFDSENQDDTNITQRSEEINQIAKSIIELSELFQDLNNLVIDQGTLLDRIDYNIETMGQNIQQANVELRAAVNSQSRSGRGMCVLFLVLCCALLLAVILSKPFWRLIGA